MLVHDSWVLWKWVWTGVLRGIWARHYLFQNQQSLTSVAIVVVVVVAVPELLKRVVSAILAIGMYSALANIPPLYLGANDGTFPHPLRVLLWVQFVTVVGVVGVLLVLWKHPVDAEGLELRQRRVVVEMNRRRGRENGGTEAGETQPRPQCCWW